MFWLKLPPLLPSNVEEPNGEPSGEGHSPPMFATPEANPDIIFVRWSDLFYFVVFICKFLVQYLQENVCIYVIMYMGVVAQFGTKHLKMVF